MKYRVKVVRMMRQEAWTEISANSEDEAIREAFDQVDADLCILDWSQPRMNDRWYDEIEEIK